MSQTAATAAHKVPFGQKVAFGLGMLANQMFPAALGIFMVVLVQDMGFPGWMWGVLFFLPRVFDSVTDPIMGFISDNTRSTWGRRKQCSVDTRSTLPWSSPGSLSPKHPRMAPNSSSSPSKATC